MTGVLLAEAASLLGFSCVSVGVGGAPIGGSPIGAGGSRWPAARTRTRGLAPPAPPPGAKVVIRGFCSGAGGGVGARAAAAGVFCCGVNPRRLIVGLAGAAALSGGEAGGCALLPGKSANETGGIGLVNNPSLIGGITVGYRLGPGALY